MPTATLLQNSDDSLFIGLQAYTEVQSNIFYGRDEETDRLTNLVKANTLTIVFGKSGTGKTSLLNAGVFPRLRKDYFLPFKIRLEFKEDSPDLVRQIKNILKSEIDKYGFKVESYPTNETLWEYFHSEPLWKSVTPILIFDQFEEIFTLAKKSEHFSGSELAEFWEEMADMIENSIPVKLKEKFLNDKENIGYNYKDQKIKILFAFREEFLPEFESITSKIPSIKYSRFRLMPMNGNQAYEVITRTWNNKIDPQQANKIIGFFSNETDKNKSFDLMEIEPSLLSQVCSYIDKQRMNEGTDKISAEFLNKYPKETILRSIYNETLSESNDAVNNGESEINLNTKPVNEFLEDKLITDEGFRTKYSFTDEDEKLKPGIDVLKKKYFVRDDGKSIELTHDVLTPLIKSDREERRKEIAVAAARKRANRRSLVIIFFALIAAGVIWYLIANKAIADKNEAIKQKGIIDVQIKNATASLAIIGNSIKVSQAHLDALKKNNKRNLLDNSSHASMIEEYKNDSVHTAFLQKQFDDLSNQKLKLQHDMDLEKSQIADLLNDKKKLISTNNDTKRMNDFLQSQLSFDSNKLVLLQKNYDDLRKEFHDYRINHPEFYSPEGRKNEENFADTNSLKLNLHYGFSKTKAPDNLKIYLIPYNNENKKIINKAELYEVGCDVLNLNKAKDNKTAKYKEGTYSFYDVAPGKYFIKICAYYGGFYTYTKKSSGNVTVNFDASPPIR
jgi:hypothetical protein